MEVRFENTYKVTKAEYKRWVGINPWKYPFTYVWILLMVASLVFISWPFLFVIIEIFCIYRAFFRLKFIQAMRYQSMAQRQGCDEWNRTIQFGEQIIVLDGNTNSTYDWGKNTKMREVNGYHKIIIRDGLELIVKNDGFTLGTLEELKEYLRLRNENSKVQSSEDDQKADVE